MKTLLILSEPIKDIGYLIQDVNNIINNTEIHTVMECNANIIKDNYDHVFYLNDTTHLSHINIINYIIKRKAYNKPIHLIRLAKWSNSYQVYRIGNITKINSSNEKYGGKVEIGINVTRKLTKMFNNERLQ